MVSAEATAAATSGIASDYMIIAVVLCAIFFLLFPFFSTIRAIDTFWAAGIKPDYPTLFAINLRRFPMKPFVKSMIEAHQAGVAITLVNLQTHHLCGGNIEALVASMVAAKRANIDLPFAKASTLLLGGHNVIALIEQAAKSNQRTIEIPNAKTNIQY